jgi:hypothetical protein
MKLLVVSPNIGEFKGREKVEVRSTAIVHQGHNLTQLMQQFVK